MATKSAQKQTSEMFAMMMWFQWDMARDVTRAGGLATGLAKPQPEKTQGDPVCRGGRRQALPLDGGGNGAFAALNTIGCATQEVEFESFRGQA
ncbi:hypothetical protein [Jannaschia faecimaris]|uniref:hypothetical protein n=1 Tax=Jannaschia faecimaris TaxID=1244108 RepID=UPI000B89111F|nr:hypothetical protein [Jannaschia faecimaris]